MTFLQMLSEQVLLFDGAMGTLLQAEVGEVPGCFEKLNQTHAQVVTKLHRAYVEAGAHVVQTNSLGGNAIKLSKVHLEDEVESLTFAAVSCAKASGARFVALSMGPTGDFITPFGALSADQVYHVYARWAKAAQEAGADLVILETQTDARESRMAAMAVRENTTLPLVISFTFEKNGRTLMGTPPDAAALSLAPFAHALGMNCSGGPRQMLAPMAAIRNVINLPLIVQPNAGLPRIEDGKTIFPCGALEMATLMGDIMKAGASGIGGCCGTTPAHIAQMNTLLPASRPNAVWDGVGRVTSMRQACTLEEALCAPYAITPVSQTDALDKAYDVPDEASALLIALDALSPEQIQEMLPEMQAATTLPLFFAASDALRLETALRYTHGICGVKTSKGNEALLMRYGAHMI